MKNSLKIIIEDRKAMVLKKFHFAYFILIMLITFTAGCAKGTDEDRTIAQNAAAREVPVKEISDTAKSPKVTFVEIGSVRCIPCKMMQPVMEKVESNYGDQVNIIFHDIWTDEGRPYAQQYGIRVIPTQVFLDAAGREYYRHEGFFPYEQLEIVLKKGGVN